MHFLVLIEKKSRMCTGILIYSLQEMYLLIQGVSFKQVAIELLKSLFLTLSNQNKKAAIFLLLIISNISSTQ